MKDSAQKDPHNNDKAGEPKQGKPAFIAIGKFRRSHGVKGEIKMEILTHFPERIVPGISVYIGEKHLKQQVKSARMTHQEILVSFEDILNCEDVSQFTNQIAYMRIEDIPALPEDEFYLFELIGMRVVTEDNEFLGTLREVMETKANDVFVIQKDDESPELLLPVIDSVILDIDFEEEVITVTLPEWA